MRFSEEQVKEIVALRENMLQQIDKHQEGIEMLEKNITLLDEFLKDSSFTKASQLEIKNESKMVENNEELRYTGRNGRSGYYRKYSPCS